MTSFDSERTTQEKSLTRVLARTFEAMTHAATPNPKPERLPWVESTIERILRLPWDREDWQEGARPPSTEAVSHLLAALYATMQPDSPIPDIGPMWDGGVCAEWHRNRVDLELYAAPDGNVRWSFEDLRTGEEEQEESGQPVRLLPTSKFPDYIIKLHGRNEKK